MYSINYNLICICIFLEFIDSTVVYNIKSPTVDLSKVFFPSVVVCNLNILRRSFIISLLNETKIGQNVDFVQLHSLIDNVFLTGGNIELSDDEQDIIDSKTNDTFLQNGIYVGEWKQKKLRVLLLVLKGGHKIRF